MYQTKPQHGPHHFTSRSCVWTESGVLGDRSSTRAYTLGGPQGRFVSHRWKWQCGNIIHSYRRAANGYSIYQSTNFSRGYPPGESQERPFIIQDVQGPVHESCQYGEGIVELSATGWICLQLAPFYTRSIFPVPDSLDHLFMQWLNGRRNCQVICLWLYHVCDCFWCPFNVVLLQCDKKKEYHNTWTIDRTLMYSSVCVRVLSFIIFNLYYIRDSYGVWICGIDSDMLDKLRMNMHSKCMFLCWQHIMCW